MNNSLETHLLYFPDKLLLGKERNRINGFLALNSDKYEFPVIKEGNNHKWEVETTVIKLEDENTPFSENNLPSVLVVRRKSTFPWKNYVPTRDHEFWETLCKTEDFTMTRSLALLIPEKNLAIDLRDPIFEKYKGIKSSLRKAGYNIIKKPYEDTLDQEKEFLGDEIHEETFFPWIVSFLDDDLHYIMRKRKSVKSFDKRAYQIIDELTKGIVEASKINTDDIKYQLVTYALILKKEEDLYISQQEEIERGMMNVHDVPAKRATNGGIEKIFRNLPPSKALGIRSVIQTPKGLMHIPMIDFLPGRPVRQDRFLREIEPDLKYHRLLPGMLVDSGKSAHFYSFNLMDTDRWGKFMDAAHQFYFSDKKFFEIQKESGSTILRISPSNQKLYQPTLVKIIK